MFKPKTTRIAELATKYPERIVGLKKIFYQPTNIYIDYANVRPWADKLRWHIDLKRLKQFFDSFDNVKIIKIYNGTLTGDKDSEELNRNLIRWGYDLKTKSVKIMKKSIDVSSISSGSPDILKDFIRKPLLNKFKVETIEYLNKELSEMNEQGVLHIEDRKCNFDVEIGRDMLVDYDNDGVETFILWSGDSDFAGPVGQLLEDGKKVYLFATVRKVAAELGDLQEKGLMIYDIKKIKEFICWKKEITS